MNREHLRTLRLLVNEASQAPVKLPETLAHRAGFLEEQARLARTYLANQDLKRARGYIDQCAQLVKAHALAPMPKWGQALEIADTLLAELADEEAQKKAKERSPMETCARCNLTYPISDPHDCPLPRLSATTASPTVESVSAPAAPEPVLSAPEQCDDGKKPLLAPIPLPTRERLSKEDIAKIKGPLSPWRRADIATLMGISPTLLSCAVNQRERINVAAIQKLRDLKPETITLPKMDIPPVVQAQREAWQEKHEATERKKDEAELAQLRAQITTLTQERDHARRELTQERKRSAELGSCLAELRGILETACAVLKERKAL